MLEWIKFHNDIRKFGAEERRIEKAYAKERETKKVNKDFDLEASEESERFELRTVEDERAVVETRWLVSQAYRYGLAIPDYNDKESWDESIFSGQRILEREALGKLRIAVRKERNERWELGLKLLTAATGVVGALIGLIAIWKK